MNIDTSVSASVYDSVREWVVRASVIGSVHNSVGASVYDSVNTKLSQYEY
jgi:hypothetical protein